MHVAWRQPLPPEVTHQSDYTASSSTSAGGGAPQRGGAFADDTTPQSYRDAAQQQRTKRGVGGMSGADLAPPLPAQALGRTSHEAEAHDRARRLYQEQQQHQHGHDTSPLFPSHDMHMGHHPQGLFSPFGNESFWPGEVEGGEAAARAFAHLGIHDERRSSDENSHETMINNGSAHSRSFALSRDVTPRAQDAAAAAAGMSSPFGEDFDFDHVAPHFAQHRQQQQHERDAIALKQHQHQTRHVRAASSSSTGGGSDPDSMNGSSSGSSSRQQQLAPGGVPRSTQRPAGPARTASSTSSTTPGQGGANMGGILMSTHPSSSSLSSAGGNALASPLSPLVEPFSPATSVASGSVPRNEVVFSGANGSSLPPSSASHLNVSTGAGAFHPASGPAASTSTNIWGSSVPLAGDANSRSAFSSLFPKSTSDSSTSSSSASGHTLHQRLSSSTSASGQMHLQPQQRSRGNGALSDVLEHDLPPFATSPLSSTFIQSSAPFGEQSYAPDSALFSPSARHQDMRFQQRGSLSDEHSGPNGQASAGGLGITTSAADAAAAAAWSGGGPSQYFNADQSSDHQASHPTSPLVSSFMSASMASSQTPTSTVPTMGSAGGPPSFSMHDEEISTLFIVGFPDDMAEREFHNMFLFAPGFEAATLKIPVTTAAAREQQRDNLLATAASLRSEASSPSLEDPFSGFGSLDPGSPSLVSPSATAPGTPAPGVPSISHVLSSAGGQQRMQRVGSQQIIGFAKFRTRAHAIAARDVLQGRRVDEGAALRTTATAPAAPSTAPPCVLKVEMAKKNLHTKQRSNTSPASPLVLPLETSSHSQPSRAPLPPPGNANGNTSSAYGALYSMPSQADTRSRDAIATSLAGTGNSSVRGSSASRASVTSTDYFDDTLLGAPTPQAAFDRTTVAQQQHSPSSSASASPRLRAQLQYSGGLGSNAGSLRGMMQQLEEAAEHQQAQAMLQAQQQAQQPTSPLEQDLGRSPNPGASQPNFNISAVLGGGSLPRTQNPADMNAPKNTLYVGGLPAVLPSLTGPFSAAHLEDTLRNVFSRCPGFRRLSFRAKNGSPIVFVEFQDVIYATQAVRDMYGHTLGGLVKGGIRLSYSKNPLGVRGNNNVLPPSGALGNSTTTDAALAAQYRQAIAARDYSTHALPSFGSQAGATAAPAFSATNQLEPTYAQQAGGGAFAADHGAMSPLSEYVPPQAGLGSAARRPPVLQQQPPTYASQTSFSPFASDF